MSNLRTAGLMADMGNGKVGMSLGATQLARTILGDEYSAPAVRLEDWAGKLGLCPRKIFTVMLSDRWRDFSKEELAKVSGYSLASSGFQNALSELCTLDLAHRTPKGIRINTELNDL